MDTVETPSPNGVTELAEQLPEPQLRLGTVALRRLQRLQARVDGATEVAQAAINAHNAQREAYQAAFLAACEDSGIEVPPGPHDVDIDWVTGRLHFVPKHD